MTPALLALAFLAQPENRALPHEAQAIAVEAVRASERYGLPAGLVLVESGGRAGLIRWWSRVLRRWRALRLPGGVS